MNTDAIFSDKSKTARIVDTRSAVIIGSIIHILLMVVALTNVNGCGTRMPPEREGEMLRVQLLGAGDIRNCNCQNVLACYLHPMCSADQLAYPLSWYETNVEIISLFVISRATSWYSCIAGQKVVRTFSFW